MPAWSSDEHAVVPVESGDVERFRRAVAERLGLFFEDAKLGFLADVLRRRVGARRQSAPVYLTGLEQGAVREEMDALARELTVAETYFFRNVEQFRALSELVLPARLQARGASKRIQLLSVGCASGEEAFSLAIVTRELPIDASWDIAILGVDVNSAMLARAAQGRFSSWALRETPEAVLRRWFRSDGRDAVLDEDIRRSVRFEKRNLADDNPDLWRSDTYDVIFCRNVVMYLTPVTAQTLVARMTRALVPGGYLFLGHAETLRGLSSDFHLCHTHGTFYYQRKERLDDLAGRVMTAARTPSDSSAGLETLLDGADSWVDAIRKASERIQALTDSPRPPVASGATARMPAVARPDYEAHEDRKAQEHHEEHEGHEGDWNHERHEGHRGHDAGRDLGVAFEMLRKERFADALQLVRSQPAETARDPDLLLLHAVLLTHSGQLGEADEMCRRLLAVDELNAGAHYVLALCHEGSGDRQGAIDHDQVAVYLDPGFAMPRLHLGLLARRGGDREGARRELEQALILLEREEASRILLFGGGFSREGLIALCRAEWRACGGRR